MKSMTRTFLTGLVTILPVAATFYLLAWIVMAAEAVLGSVMQSVLPEGLYWPGLGVAVLVLLIFLIGLFMRTWVAQKLFSWGEALLYRMPVVKTVYGPLRDFFDVLTDPKQKGLQQVVAVRFGGSGVKLIGFVTRRELCDLPQGINDADTVAVYLPLSYQIGGYMVLVPRSAVEPVDMSLEDAMRLTLTAGVSTKANRK
jgi:uncharacterized membrane protein